MRQQMNPQRVVFVTGPSGAGRSTAINVLEDLGFEAIDNIPLRLIPRLLDGQPGAAPMALGIDVRNRDFSPERMLDLHASLSGTKGIEPSILFLDCRSDVLLRRFSETRRRHPMSPEDSPLEGIIQEENLLLDVKRVSEYYIDTSDLTPHDLRGQIHSRFGATGQETLAVSIQSFSYKRGLPQGADIVLDCRFLRNPHWQENLRKMNGTEALVADFVRQDPMFAPFRSRSMSMVEFLLPACRKEGKAHFTVAFGCTGGQHRSVALAESVADGLAQQGWQVSIRHIEMERRGILVPSVDEDNSPGDQQA